MSGLKPTFKITLFQNMDVVDERSMVEEAVNIHYAYPHIGLDSVLNYCLSKRIYQLYECRMLTTQEYCCLGCEFRLLDPACLAYYRNLPYYLWPHEINETFNVDFVDGFLEQSGL